MDYRLICGKNPTAMAGIPDNSMDCIVTDPPYGAKFMGKDWDKALPSVEIWKECLRVLKPGAFAFVMCLPRSDLNWRMKRNIEEAGFRTDFTPIYWAFATGFPKAQNISKVIEKRHRPPDSIEEVAGCGGMTSDKGYNVTNHHEHYDEYRHPDAVRLDGSFGGFQPKPAVEEIIVAMKPMDEKTFVDQSLNNRKGISWLGDGRIPTQDDFSIKFGGCSGSSRYAWNVGEKKKVDKEKPRDGGGRFPANLLVSDDVLNDGRVSKGSKGSGFTQTPARAAFIASKAGVNRTGFDDSGSFSRYFSLDAWFDKTFPFLIVPKPSKVEKNAGCNSLPEKQVKGGGGLNNTEDDVCGKYGSIKAIQRNNHPTCKPIRLMAYLIILGSRPGDVILDPFLGSGTTCCAAILCNRKSIGVDMSEEYLRIAKARCEHWQELKQAKDSGMTIEEKRAGQGNLF